MTSLEYNTNQNKLKKYNKPQVPMKYSKVVFPVQTLEKKEGTSKDWSDLVYRYFVDVDALKLYFVRIVPGMVATSDDLDPGLTVDYDTNNKILAVEVQTCSKLLVSIPYGKEGMKKRAMELCAYYDAQQDIFEVFFLFPEALPVRTSRLDDTSIHLLYNSDSQIIGLRFLEASKTIHQG
mmetsp:Transcript_25264/g.35396  ORF Transcript_25264/g.35396 Transcript_25264/m.35396 type:complete len:179 (+) Transcript_25264:444-980(+)|eukprot:CAMPEP_0168549760 /NCGR_PEP_ID=MMETSP0413-20121227/5273_1 /TAXON_ID=136452 /ORGANISM="Filamoeba nolandi, Strain NC-AS-23-1" /LENGTH=178 /DNA_ID=CAMNT_0008580165 /DNA_START=877 /DNA_END=1409 /DNA_ORIENTATION=+